MKQKATVLPLIFCVFFCQQNFSVPVNKFPGDSIFYQLMFDKSLQNFKRDITGLGPKPFTKTIQRATWCYLVSRYGQVEPGLVESVMIAMNKLECPCIGCPTSSFPEVYAQYGNETLLPFERGRVFSDKFQSLAIKALKFRDLGIPVDVNAASPDHVRAAFYYGLVPLAEAYIRKGSCFDDVDKYDLRPMDYLFLDGSESGRFSIVDPGSEPATGDVTKDIFDNRRKILGTLHNNGIELDGEFKIPENVSCDGQLRLYDVEDLLHLFDCPKSRFYRCLQSDNVIERIISFVCRQREIEGGVKKIEEAWSVKDNGDDDKDVISNKYLFAAFFNGLPKAVEAYIFADVNLAVTDDFGHQPVHQLFLDQDEECRLAVHNMHSIRRASKEVRDGRRKILELLLRHQVPFAETFTMSEPWANPGSVGTHNVRDLLGLHGFIWDGCFSGEMHNLAPDKAWASERLGELIDQETGKLFDADQDYVKRLLILGGNPRSVKTKNGEVALASVFVDDLISAVHKKTWSDIARLYKCIGVMLSTGVKDGYLDGDLYKAIPVLLNFGEVFKRDLKALAYDISVLYKMRRKKGEGGMPKESAQALIMDTGLFDPDKSETLYGYLGRDCLRRCFASADGEQDLLDKLLAKYIEDKTWSETEWKFKGRRMFVRRSLELYAPFVSWDNPCLDGSGAVLYPSRVEAVQDIFDTKFFKKEEAESDNGLAKYGWETFPSKRVWPEGEIGPGSPAIEIFEKAD